MQIFHTNWYYAWINTSIFMQANLQEMEDSMAVLGPERVGHRESHPYHYSAGLQVALNLL